MTAHQYGTLKYILEHNVNLNREARSLHMGTIGSLIKRGWLNHNGGMLILTDKGLEEYETYRRPQANYRKYEKDISNHVKNLLHVNRLLIMKRTA